MYMQHYQMIKYDKIKIIKITNTYNGKQMFTFIIANFFNKTKLLGMIILHHRYMCTLTVKWQTNVVRFFLCLYLHITFLHIIIYEIK